MGQPFGTPLEAITVLFGPHGLIRVPAALTIVITGTVRMPITPAIKLTARVVPWTEAKENADAVCSDVRVRALWLERRPGRATVKPSQEPSQIIQVF